MTFEDFFRKFTILWEGGLCNDPDDPGGKTKYGITQNRFLQAKAKKAVFSQRIEYLTRAEAVVIAREFYYIPMNIYKLPYPLNLFVFDFTFNGGPGAGIKKLQEALNKLIPDANLKTDGVIGPKTMAAIERIKNIAELIELYQIKRSEFYYSLAKSKKHNFSKFLAGWLNRTNDLTRFMAPIMAEVSK